MKINYWTSKLVAVIAAERGMAKAWKRAMAAAAMGAALAVAAGTAGAQTINHVIEESGFDEIDLTQPPAMPFGTGHYAYVRNIPEFPWVAVRGNNNSWLYNSLYAVGSGTTSAPRSADNALHLADGNVLQIVDDTFVSGREYTLSAWVRYDSDQWVGDDFGLRLFDGTNDTFDGAVIFAAQDYLFGVDIFDDDTWRQMSLSYTAGATAHGKPIGIYLGPEVEANRITVDDVTLTSVAVTLPGDHNGDNVVDALDYVVWRSDPAGNGGDDGYADWAENFGNPPGSGAVAGQPSVEAAVPEPASCFIIWAGAAGFLLLGRRFTK